jgi:PRTRC genetic system ThiF family protein
MSSISGSDSPTSISLARYEEPRLVIPSECADLAFSRWNIFLVGCGGTGSFAAQHLARLMAAGGLAAERIASLTLVDHDRVEGRNVGRQWFAPGDVGRHKAEVLAERYSRAFGLAIGYAAARVRRDSIGEHALIPPGSLREPTLILAAVDNARARRAIYQGVRDAAGPRRAVFWFDAGNRFQAGQVAWGSTADPALLQEQLERPLVEYVPYPPLVFPELLEDEADGSAPPPDCAEDVAAGAQGPNINAQMGLLLAEMPRQFLLGELRTHYTAIDFRDLKVASQPLTRSWLAGLAERARKEANP